MQNLQYNQSNMLVPAKPSSKQGTTIATMVKGLARFSDKAKAPKAAKTQSKLSQFFGGGKPVAPKPEKRKADTDVPEAEDVATGALKEWLAY